MAESFTTVTAPTVATIPAAASGEATQMMMNFWPRVQQEIKEMSPVIDQTDFKNQELPLARIKKIMKLDEDVKMISQEAPVVFARATEMFISELTLRSWIHTEENKRRTLQRNDIAMAISKYDQFDFLIDIVPRDELKPPKRPDETTQRTAMMPDQVQYYFQLAQQHQAALSQTSQPATNNNTQQTQQQPQQIQLQVNQPQQQQVMQQPVQLQLANTNVGQTVTATNEAGQPQVIQVQSAQTLQQPQQPATQVIHQIVTPSGEVQNVPIQLTAAQLQSLQLQVQGQRAGQPIVLQTAANVQAPQIQAAQAAPDQQQQQQQPLFQIQQLPFTSNGQQVLQQVFQLPAAGTVEDNQEVGDGS